MAPAIRLRRCPLIDADRAYVQSGGSFRAVIVSLLTSDCFIYRKTKPTES